jgi:hypothetical protein
MFEIQVPLLDTVHRVAKSPIRFNPTNRKRLEGAADARHRVRRRPFVLQVPDNKADAVPCERLPFLYYKGEDRFLVIVAAIKTARIPVCGRSCFA